MEHVLHVLESYEGFCFVDCSEIATVRKDVPPQSGGPSLAQTPLFPEGPQAPPDPRPGSKAPLSFARKRAWHEW